ncbi:unnamed protein product [Onchocerca ochengi]|uniref:Aa_trans domain-containing protein n=1 Tax=Onchocerca ochengi TaxID=42157 RepID=A0A182E6M0_ONCOC|nr:unnamed protein product [Onchocerca ochengi]
MYTAVGLFGYIAFYDVELYGDILLYLQNSLLTQLLKLAFMLSVAVSIPLMLFPGRIAFYNFLMKPVSIIIGSLMLVGSTWAVLHTEQETNVVDIILPKRIDDEKVEIALKHLEKIKIDDNSTKLQACLQIYFLNTFSERKQKEEAVRSGREWKGKQSVGDITNQETKTVSREIKEQRKEQDKILKEQETTVDKLKKHNEMLEKVTVTMAGISKKDVNVKQTKEVKTSS